MSRCSPLTNQALAGIIKRQPTSLDLSWTPLAKRQLNCLLIRLPGTDMHTVHPACPIPSPSASLLCVFRSERAEGDWSVLVLSVRTGLSHSALSAAAGSALVRRPERRPDQGDHQPSWSVAVQRSLHRRLCSNMTVCVCPPPPAGSESSRSRLRNMVTLCLSGLDISESTLRLLQRHMPQLERLDLAHCRDITDSSIALLAAAGTHTRNNLAELTLAGECVCVCSAVFEGQSSPFGSRFR